MMSRVDRGAVANWWWTVDRPIMAACLMLIGLGVFLSFASTPSVATRIGIADSFHFVKLHIKYIVPAFIAMITISFFSPYNIKRFCMALIVVALFLLVLVLFKGMETKGSFRWISIFGASIQPSEFMKPAFVVVSAWLFAQHDQNKRLPSYTLAIGLFIVTVILLVLEPDVGQTILITAVWGGLFFLAGIPWFVVVLFLAIAVVGGFGAYIFLHHVHERINAFLHGEGDTFQVDAGREAIINGGWFGQGPGEGTIKRIIPDAHTDFVFSVAAEEYGIIFCMLIVALFGFVVLRSLYFSSKEQDKFTSLAIAGLAMLFGLQALINIAVNLHLMPPKGMTLPFISYGGSSLVAIGITTGLLLALTRKRPETRMVQNYRK